MHSKPRILLTGSQGKFGRWLLDNLKDYNIEGGTRAYKGYGTFDIVIHNAFNTGKDLTTKDIYQYTQDNIELTNYVLDRAHRIIFISSIDVYPKNTDLLKTEDMIYPLSEVPSPYGLCKLLCENLAKNRNSAFILRPSSLLGHNSTSGLANLLQGKPCKLSGESKMNVITYQMLRDVILYGIRNEIEDTINVVASDSIQISHLEHTYEFTYADKVYDYDCGKLSNKKLIDLIPSANVNSIQAIQQYTQ